MTDFPLLIFACAQALAAVLCVFAAVQTEAAGRNGAADARVWRVFAMLLLLLVANTLIRGDLALVGWLRGLARDEAWYEFRRPLQFAVLLLLGYMCTVVWQRMDAALSGLRVPRPARMARVGMSLLLAMLCLRAVSFHYTDELTQQRLLGLSVGRWLDLLGLGLLMLAAMRQTRNAFAHGQGRHV